MGKKSEEKKSFKLYNDYKKHFDQMTDEDAGRVIKAILAYVNYEGFPELDGAAGMAFSFIEAQLERDRIAYDKKCETNKENGSKGGRPKRITEDTAENEEPKKTQKNRSVFLGFQKKPRKPKKEKGNRPKPNTRRDSNASGKYIRGRLIKKPATGSMQQG